MTLAQKEMIKNLLNLPHAAIILNEVHKKLEEEQKRRETFYNEISEYEKAEFINGEILIHSPVKKAHNDVSGRLHRLLSVYVDKYQIGYVGIEKIMISLSRNDYEPDICFFAKEQSQHFHKDQSLFPAPDLIVEILSPRTEANDRGVKFQDYQAHQVREYWIIDPGTEIIEQYRLNDQGLYDLVIKSHNGALSSEVIIGLTIEVESLFDENKNLEELSKILSQ